MEEIKAMVLWHNIDIETGVVINADLSLFKGVPAALQVLIEKEQKAISGNALMKLRRIPHQIIILP